MAAPNYLNNQPGGITDRIAAFFADRDDAYGAVQQLKDAGFANENIGFAVANDENVTPASAQSAKVDDRSFGQKLKDFFTGEDYTDRTGFQTASAPLGWNNERYTYYQHGILAGGAVVTVNGPRLAEARRILETNGGDLRESGFDVNQNEYAADTAAEHRIELRGELLRVFKERVSRGEVKLRKDVVTEKKTIEVPVTREELVIERTPASGEPTGEIGTDKEIRVPLTEERVRVQKHPVVNEEVHVGKRQVQSTEQVSDNVKHEELRVDKEGAIDISEKKKKDPAA